MEVPWILRQKEIGSTVLTASRSVEPWFEKAVAALQQPSPIDRQGEILTGVSRSTASVSVEDVDV